MAVRYYLWIAFFPILSLGLCPHVFAETLETERMTWVEIRDALVAGKTTIVIPTGGTEQNGPHMITGKHNFIIAETARRIAAKLGDALVAPVLPFVPEGSIDKREGHMAYTGTISLPPEPFAAVLISVADSYRAHGFKTIVFVGEHGASIEPQAVVAKQLSSDWAGDGVRVINADSYYSANGGAEWLKSQGVSITAIGFHASIQDTSELMAVYPEGVHLDRSVADKDGVRGDPAKASAELGRKLLDLKVEAAVKQIQSERTKPAEPHPGPSLLEQLYRYFLK